MLRRYVRENKTFKSICFSIIFPLTSVSAAASLRCQTLRQPNARTGTRSAPASRRKTATLSRPSASQGPPLLPQPLSFSLLLSNRWFSCQISSCVTGKCFILSASQPAASRSGIVVRNRCVCGPFSAPPKHSLGHCRICCSLSTTRWKEAYRTQVPTGFSIDYYFVRNHDPPNLLLSLY